MQDNTENQIRLQLFLARAGVASRRASEQIISDGRVSVNNKVVTQMGTKVSLNDIVCLDGKQLTLESKKRYVLLFKPAGYVCSLSDEKGRDVAVDLLKDAFPERLYNVGRLDMFSQGLIIFTNDGEFAASLSHPSSQIQKEYVVDTSLPIPKYLAENFTKGIRIDNVFYKCLEAEQLNARRMRVVLIEGKNREIRKVFDHFDVGIKTLTRIRIGSLKIDGLQSGAWRELSEEEIRSLYGNSN